MSAKEEYFAPLPPEGTGSRRDLFIKPQPNQYEDKELREIENALMQLANFPSHHKLKKAMQLITRKQLEARIDELNSLDEGELMAETNTHVRFIPASKFKRRIAELTKQEGKG